jgi:hypothetical protein
MFLFDFRNVRVDGFVLIRCHRLAQSFDDDFFDGGFVDLILFIQLLFMRRLVRVTNIPIHC